MWLLLSVVERSSAQYDVSPIMFSYSEARELVMERFGGPLDLPDSPPVELVVADDSSQAFDFGWIMFLRVQWLQDSCSGKELPHLAGVDAVFVECETGRIIPTFGSTTIAQRLVAYRACGNPMACRSGRFSVALPPGGSLDRASATRVIRELTCIGVADVAALIDSLDSHEQVVFPDLRARSIEEATASLEALGLRLEDEWV